MSIACPPPSAWRCRDSTRLDDACCNCCTFCDDDEEKDTCSLANRISCLWCTLFLCTSMPIMRPGRLHLSHLLRLPHVLLPTWASASLRSCSILCGLSSRCLLCSVCCIMASCLLKKKSFARLWSIVVTIITSLILIIRVHNLIQNFLL